MGDKLTLLIAEDWEGLYVNGKLTYESHEVRRNVLVKAMRDHNTFDVAFEYFSVDGTEWLEGRGNLPSNFNDIPKEYIC